MSSPRVFVHAVGITNALGTGCEAVGRGLLEGSTGGMVLEDGWLPDGPARVGRVAAELPQITDALRDFDCRCNRLVLAAVHEMREALDAMLARVRPERFGVVLGTSTAGIAEGEDAMAKRVRDGRFPTDFRYARQEIGRAAAFAAACLGVSGPAYMISTACTSSVKSISAACRLVQAGVCDAVLTGGADALCRLTVSGFAALESTTVDLCNPLSLNRRGINIGEGVALLLVSRHPGAIEVLGWGESSDAHHISAPDPAGVGAEIAMRAALAQSGLSPASIDYLNLHATATPKNDLMEAQAVDRVFPHGVPCSGTKPLTGHTLGAAGATEVAFCWLALQGDGRLPPHVWDGVADPQLPILMQTRLGDRFRRNHDRACMSNSFAFGGSNASLILGDGR